MRVPANSVVFMVDRPAIPMTANIHETLKGLQVIGRQNPVPF
jgi:hypothetical protein